jgi:SAM-dependent methyltransferase
MKAVGLLAQLLPPRQRETLRQRLVRFRNPAYLGTLRRTSPISDNWGRDRGTPIDRYYIERFLESERSVVRGRALELLNSAYVERFDSGVSQCDVLDIDPRNPRATIVADLTAADGVPSDTFDCFILTQTLQFIFDTRAALLHSRRILRPGGTLLCTVPSVSRISRRGLENEYWRFTTASCRALFGEVFGEPNIEVRSYGNVLTAIAFLTGISYEEISRRKLDADDPYFPVVVTVRATKR